MVKKALASLGPDCYRFMPVQSGFGSPSLDFLCCVKGMFIAVETKAGTGSLTPRQVATIDYMHQAGAKVFVVRDQASCDTMLAELRLKMEFDPNARSPSNPTLTSYTREFGCRFITAQEQKSDE